MAHLNGQTLHSIPVLRAPVRKDAIFLFVFAGIGFLGSFQLGALAFQAFSLSLVMVVCILSSMLLPEIISTFCGQVRSWWQSTSKRVLVGLWAVSVPLANLVSGSLHDRFLAISAHPREGVVMEGLEMVLVAGTVLLLMSFKSWIVGVYWRCRADMVWPRREVVQTRFTP